MTFKELAKHLSCTAVTARKRIFSNKSLLEKYPTLLEMKGKDGKPAERYIFTPLEWSAIRAEYGF